MAETRRPWKKWAAYGAFALASFAFALRQTAPVDALAERLVLEAAAAGWQLRLADAAPAGFAGVRMTGVTLESADGARFPVDEVTARLRILPLLLGRRSVDFDAALYGGRIEGTAEQGAAARRLVARLERVDLGRAAVVRRLAGVDLAGAVSGDVDLSVDPREPAKASGRLALAVDQAAIQGGEVQVAAMGGGALTLPRVALGTVTARATVKDGRATFEALSAKGGGDLEVEGEGLTVQLQPRLASAPLFGRARLRFADAFWQKGGTANMRGLVELALAPGRAPDGSYGLQLYGTLSSPQARPAPPPAAGAAGAAPAR